MVRLTKKQKQDKRELLSSLNHMDLNSTNHHHAADNEAYQHVRENLTELNGKPEIDETDLVFLKGILDSPAVTQIIKIQDAFEEGETLHPVRLDNTQLCRELVHKLSRDRNIDARELARILSKPHFKALIETHDEIGARSYDPKPPIDPIKVLPKEFIEITDNGMGGAETIRMVGLRRKPNEPLGLTVEVDDNNQLVVARIIAGGMIDRQALLHQGDVILEVNGVPVSTPEQLQDQILLAKESVTLKIGPSVDEEMRSGRLLMAGGQVKHGRNLDSGKKLTCYMRALFDYEPEDDTLLPCKEIGLPFKYGDVLQIINVKDPNWWQARHYGDSETTGLIPSQELEERRKAFVPPEADYVHTISICGTKISKRKLKKLYKTKENAEYDKNELQMYEEVTRMPPFKRKTLVLVGVQGVGRRTLKNRLINSDPTKFGTVIPHTSRPPRMLEETGKNYWFIDREEMEEEIRNNNFLEYGEHNENLYGTHLDSIRDVIKQGKMCVLDCAPNALKMLHNSTEFMPYVIFIGAPGMEQLKQLYAERRATGGSQRNLTFDRQSSIRYSSRRARTLESLASLYEDDDLIQTVEESALLQRKYEKYVDMVIVNEDFDITFRKVVEALNALAETYQWVPVNWIY